MKQNERTKDYIDTKYIFLLASLLDPQFKSLLLVDEIQRAEITNLLLQFYQKQKQIEESKIKSKEEQEEQAQELQDAIDSFQLNKKKIVTIFGDIFTYENKEQNQDKEFYNYIKIPQVSEFNKNSCMKWCKITQKNFRQFQRLAKEYLCMKISSVESERVFSSPGFILNEKRNSLTSDNFNKLLFLQKNNLFVNQPNLN